MGCVSVALSRPARGTRVLVPARGDVGLGAAVALASVVLVLAVPAGPPYRAPDAVAVALAAGGSLALLWRSVLPLATLAAAGLAVVGNAAAGHAIGPLQWPPWIALFTCFATGGRRLRAAATVLVVLAVAGYELADRVGPARQLPGIAASFVVATVAGELTRRRARAAAEQARSAAEDRQRALAAERLLLQERGRLAGELHDALGHAVNVMVLQAGIGRRVFADNPAFAQEALGSVEAVGRGALEELDRLLRVLTPDDGGPHGQPAAPGPDELEQLVTRIGGAGRHVELRADVAGLGPSTGRAVYRIVQEALTNAVRHTAAGRITVDIAPDGDRVVVDVRNEGGPVAPLVPGRGLINMRERARLEGGELEAGPDERGFRVRAVLPLHQVGAS